MHCKANVRAMKIYDYFSNFAQKLVEYISVSEKACLKEKPLWQIS